MLGHSAGEVLVKGREECEAIHRDRLGKLTGHPLAEHSPWGQGPWARSVLGLSPACPHHSAGTVPQEGWPHTVTRMLTWV